MQFFFLFQVYLLSIYLVPDSDTYAIKESGEEQNEVLLLVNDLIKTT